MWIRISSLKWTSKKQTAPQTQHKKGGHAQHTHFAKWTIWINVKIIYNEVIKIYKTKAKTSILERTECEKTLSWRNTQSNNSFPHSCIDSLITHRHTRYVTTYDETKYLQFTAHVSFNIHIQQLEYNGSQRTNQNAEWKKEQKGKSNRKCL